jgi:hypothetical protein
MNKQTKMYVGAAVLAVAGYMVWKKMQDKKKALPAKQFAGMESDTVVGDRQRGMVGMVGMSAERKMVGLVSANKYVTDSGWVRADGASIAPTFFDVTSSDWIR